MKSEKQKRNRRIKQIILKAEAPGATRLGVAPFDMERLAWFGLRFEFWRRGPVRRAAFERMDAAELAEQKRLQTLFWAMKDWPVKRLDHLENRLTLEIDFSKVNSPDALKEQITNLIDVCWFAYAQKTGHKTLKSQKDYDLILKVGDTKKANPAMTFKAIGKKLFPKTDTVRALAEELEESGEKQAARSYKEYEDLINGGWRTLRFP